MTQMVGMRHLWILLVFSMLFSCDLWVSKEKKTRDLVNREMRAMDWNDVDAYPLFETCDEGAPKTEQRECFEQELLSQFSKTLKRFEFVFDSDVNPTVTVDFLVDQTGKIEVLAIERDVRIANQMPEFDGLVRRSLKNMPPLAPALKRGIPVNAKFRLPILLNKN
ncbi:MAG: hypothetical protein AAFX53_10165 [Bacteroidota bacterium]